LYVWTIYDLDSPYSFRSWRAFSSEGAAAIRLFVANPEQFDDPISNFFEHQLPGAITFLAFGGMLLFCFVFAYMDTYLKQVMSDEGHYATERARYLNDPKKFSPTLRA
jgi:hypothetical protein